MSLNGIPKRSDKPRKSQTMSGFDQDVSSVTASVVGLGKLGACMAAAMASRGVPTIGVDINPDPVDSIQRKRAPVFELGLAEMIAMLTADRTPRRTSQVRSKNHK
jgi:UDP-N-acetyl-D-mannosaminuronate dehydrogenase